MPTTELLVSLKIPDNVAISALAALHRMGRDIKSLERHDYYLFEFSGDKKAFERKISQVDLIVNANKHKFRFGIADDGRKKILVQNLEEDTALLKTLRESLAAKEIKKVEKGTLWVIGSSDDDSTVSDIAKGLLMNENYQKFRIIE